jgi:copper chaperone
MTTLSIPDMTCAHCKQRVETALSAVPDAGRVTVDLAGRTVQVAGPAAADALVAALDRAGYPATIAG